MDQNLINKLNNMLKQEHACAIRYATHAAAVSGPYSESVKARLKEISQDEILHAGKLRDRILALGGKPTLEVAMEDLVYADTLEAILDINIKEEKSAITDYLTLLELIPSRNIILLKTIEEILRDEQEHLEELLDLRS